MYSICRLSPLCLPTNIWLIFSERDFIQKSLWKAVFSPHLATSTVSGVFHMRQKAVRMIIFSNLLLRILTWRHLTQARLRGYLCSTRTKSCIILFESQGGFWQLQWCNQTVLILKGAPAFPGISWSSALLSFPHPMTQRGYCSLLGPAPTCPAEGLNEEIAIT